MSTIKSQIDELRLQRQLAYKRTFAADNQAAQEVLKDLAKFCRAEETCFDADARVHAFKEGRREVYLHILKHLNLSAQEFLATFEKRSTK